MDYLPPVSVRASIRPAHLALAIALAATAVVCAGFRQNGTAVVALWCSLLMLGWTVSATVLTLVCGPGDLAGQPRPPAPHGPPSVGRTHQLGAGLARGVRRNPRIPAGG